MEKYKVGDVIIDAGTYEGAGGKFIGVAVRQKVEAYTYKMLLDPSKCHTIMLARAWCDHNGYMVKDIIVRD